MDKWCQVTCKKTNSCNIQATMYILIMYECILCNYIYHDVPFVSLLYIILLCFSISYTSIRVLEPAKNQGFDVASFTQPLTPCIPLRGSEDR